MQAQEKKRSPLAIVSIFLSVITIFEGGSMFILIISVNNGDLVGLMLPVLQGIHRSFRGSMCEILIKF